ncbi:MAG: hypothetical protein GC159_21575 [Phycisphaera sp.]|nr:hypothetical protein [Phycisphaera sp.]
MYEVELVFDAETSVWMTDEVFDAIWKHDGGNSDAELDDIKGGMLEKIEYWSRGGFWNFEGTRGIKNEGNGVYRLGLHGDLFRVYGFYEDNTKRSFIAVEPHADKKGKSNTSRERRIIGKVAKARDDGWKKRINEGEGEGGT